MVFASGNCPGSGKGRRTGKCRNFIRDTIPQDKMTFWMPWDFSDAQRSLGRKENVEDYEGKRMERGGSRE